MSEIWKPITGYEGLYLVSNMGRVYGIKYNRILKPGINPHSGYKHVSLTKKSIGRTHKIHILVCTAFHGPKPFEGAQALHKNDVQHNNSEDNLYWGTHMDNVEDITRNGKRKRRCQKESYGRP